MSYTPSQKEVSAISNLEAPQRYAYTLKRIADWGELWSLAGDQGWCLGLDDDGVETIPIWPAARYAELCCAGEWDGCRPQAISLDVWMERWVPGSKTDGRKIAVFPTTGGKGIIVDPLRLQKDLLRELDAY